MSSSAWLQSTLSELLKSPYIHFKPHPSGLRMGHGPIDLFSTRFNNIFPEDVQATVAGESVNREQLKQRLLGLQKNYKPDSTQFTPSDNAVSDDQAKIAMIGSESTAGTGPYEIGVTAVVNNNRVSKIDFDGPIELFQQNN